MYWKLPYSFNIGQNLPEKTTSLYRYLERSKLAVLWNLSLIPTLMMIWEKKFGCLDTPNLQTGMDSAQGLWVSRHPNFFSQTIINVGMRLKFESTAHLDLSKYLYRELLFQGKIGTTWQLWGDFQCLKYQIFFHRSSLFHI